jgi:hypothetical protein
MNRGRTGVSQVTGSSVHACRGQPPRRVKTSLTLWRERLPRPSEASTSSATRDSARFRGCIPTAHMLVCLRFNHDVTAATARLTTDLPGSALIGRDSHPLDGKPNFAKLLQLHSFRTSIAWPQPTRRLCAAERVGEALRLSSQVFPPTRSATQSLRVAATRTSGQRQTFSAVSFGWRRHPGISALRRSKSRGRHMGNSCDFSVPEFVGASACPMFRGQAP